MPIVRYSQSASLLVHMAITAHRQHTNLYVTTSWSMRIVGGITKCPYTCDRQVFDCASVKTVSDTVVTVWMWVSPRTCCGEFTRVSNLSANVLVFGFSLCGREHDEEGWPGVGEEGPDVESTSMQLGCWSAPRLRFPGRVMGMESRGLLWSARHAKSPDHYLTFSHSLIDPDSC